jgi:membrane-bound serine protease (ClpP class)
MSVALTDPNVAFLLLVAGAIGVYWEFHAPGAILPGLIGTLLLCLGAFGLWRDTPTWYGSLLIILAILLLGIELKLGGHGVSGLAGAVLLWIGAIALLQGSQRIDPMLAFGTSAALCIISVFLGYLGLRARRNTRLTGLERLVGERGVARTEINPQGTVFVRGEYWQARSQQAIAAGAGISVERVQDLVLYVKEA